MANNATGTENTATGAWALYSNTIGNGNTATGAMSLYSNTTGTYNTAIGVSALNLNQTGGNNTAFGGKALFNNTAGNNNCALGIESMFNNTTGSENTGLEYLTLHSNIQGIQNTAMGGMALFTNTSGYENTANGYNSLYYNLAGVRNTAIGVGALLNNTSGNYNTAIGYSAMSGNTTGSVNIAIGYNATTGAGNLTNAAIGSAAMVTTSNSLVLGKINGVNGGTANVNVGISTTSPGYALDVLSALYHTRNFINSATSADNIGVYGACNNTPYYGYGGYFEGGFMGVYGSATLSGTGTRYAVYGYAANGANNYGGYFSGNVNVTGTLSKGAGAFKIDHLLDPENKYLWHSFVENPDMMNIYNDNVTTGSDGIATIKLSDYFEALNQDFRYQLTTIGQQADAWVVSEVNNNTFTIKTDKPNVKVSWQVTGIRHDKYAEAHRIPNEIAKEQENKGKYIHWQEYGQSEEKSIDYLITRQKTKLAR